VPEYTSNFNLPKPLANENMSRAAHNDLVQSIDTNIGNALASQSTVLTQVETELTSHKADYTLQIPYAAANGSANTYAITLNPAPAAYVDGMGVAFKVNVQNTGASMINVNGLGAKAIKKATGNDVSSGNLKAGSIYSLRYNATTGNFILQGEGGEYGTAGAAQVLTGYTFGTDAGLQNGTIPLTNPSLVDSYLTPNAFMYNGWGDGKLYTVMNVPNGSYLNGVNWVRSEQPNLVAGNIKNGINIFGVAGTLQPKIDLSWLPNIPNSHSLLALDPNDNSLWARDTFTNTSNLLKISSNGTILQTITHSFNASAISLDVSENYIYWMQATNRYLTDKNGTVIYQFTASNSQAYAYLICEDVNLIYEAHGPNLYSYSLAGTAYGDVSASAFNPVNNVILFRISSNYLLFGSYTTTTIVSFILYNMTAKTFTTIFSGDLSNALNTFIKYAFKY
jgi:hypothetical protein